MMTLAQHDFLLKVADLVNRPGASRKVDLRLPVPADVDLPLVDSMAPPELEGVVESVVEGLLVRGTLRTALRMSCARCLTSVDQPVESSVLELFVDPTRPQADPDMAEEGYEIIDGMIDLELLVRDALVPAVPLQPLCRVDCAGLCPVCGANRNEGACSCREEVADSRWAALEGLTLPQEPSDSRSPQGGSRSKQ